MDRIAPLDTSRNRRKELYSNATPKEIAEYRSLAGTLMYLGTSVMPQSSLETSSMQKRINCLKMGHILEEKSVLKDIMGMKPVLKFPTISGEETQP